jgi:hypothetical protein
MKTATLKAQILDATRLSTNESSTVAFDAESPESIYLEDCRSSMQRLRRQLPYKFSFTIPVCSLFSLP